MDELDFRDRDCKLTPDTWRETRIPTVRLQRMLPAMIIYLPSLRDLLDGDPSSWQAGMWSVVASGGSVSPQ